MDCFAALSELVVSNEQREAIERVLSTILQNWEWSESIGVNEFSWPPVNFENLGLREVHAAIGTVVPHDFDAAVRLDYLCRLMRVAEAANHCETVFYSGIGIAATNERGWIQNLAETLDSLLRARDPQAVKVAKLRAALNKVVETIDAWLSTFSPDMVLPNVRIPIVETIKKLALPTNIDVAYVLVQTVPPREMFSQFSIGPEGTVESLEPDERALQTSLQQMRGMLAQKIVGDMARRMAELVASAIATMSKFADDASEAHVQQGPRTVDMVIEEFSQKLKLVDEQEKLATQLDGLVQVGSDADVNKYTHAIMKILRPHANRCIEKHLPYDELYGRILRRVQRGAIVETSIANADYQAIAPAYITAARPRDNFDSMAVHNGYVYVTAKGSKDKPVRNGSVLQYRIESGEFIKEMPGFESTEPDTQRPNGIAIVEDIAYIVDRDNASVSMAWFHADDRGGPHETWEVVNVFGTSQLLWPYGIAARPVHIGNYHHIWVTDVHKTDPERGRVVMYAVDFRRMSATGRPESVHVEFMSEFGDASGDGVVHKTESIAVSPDGRRMLVADEHEDQLNIKVYDPENRLLYFAYGGTDFKNRILSGFRGEPEGIATYNVTETDWFWVCTDQTDDPLTNSFRVYDGRSYKHVATFRIAGVSVTDGICISQTQTGGRFPEGVMVASDRDQSIVVVDLRKLRTLLTEQAAVGSMLANEDEAQRVCAVCGARADFRCPACRMPYCSRLCQKKDWPAHYIVCAQTK